MLVYTKCTEHMCANQVDVVSMCIKRKYPPHYTATERYTEERTAMKSNVTTLYASMQQSTCVKTVARTERTAKRLTQNPSFRFPHLHTPRKNHVC